MVQRRDQAGADFFVNAGDIKQKGVEITADYTTGFTGGIVIFNNSDSGICIARTVLFECPYNNFIKVYIFCSICLRKRRIRNNSQNKQQSFRFGHLVYSLHQRLMAQ